MTDYLLLANYYLLLFAYYLILITYYLLLATYDLLLTTYYVLLACKRSLVVYGILALCPSTNVKCPEVKGGIAGSGKCLHVCYTLRSSPLRGNSYSTLTKTAPLWMNMRLRNAM